MKNLLFFSILFFSVLSFGQSEKKQNKVLRLELDEARKSYQTAKSEYTTALLSYNNNSLQPMRKSLQRMKDEVTFNETIQLETFNANESLKLLLGETKTKAYYSFPSGFLPFENRMKHIDSRLKATHMAGPEVTEVMDTLRLDVCKVKFENTLIREQINSFRAAKQEYNKRTKLFSSYVPIVDLAISGIDSIYRDIIDIQRNLKHQQDSVRAELYKLEANYKKNGPNGFPQVYANEFPFAFDSINGTRLVNAETEWPMEEFGAPKQEKPYHIEKAPVIYEVVDEPAEFPGGIEALNKYFLDNLVLPESVLKGEVSGKCYVRFEVSEKGQIWQVQIRRGVTDCPECDKEAKRVIEKMPLWVPPEINGKVVAMWFNLPVKFVAP